MKKYPFSKDELTIVDRYYVAGRTDGGKAKFKTPISSLENMRAFLNNETPCWMPNGDLITITPEIVPDNVARAFVQEANPTDRKGGPDMFGVQWVYEDSAGGSMVIPGNPILKDANDWKEVIHFPDVDSWDWEKSAEENRELLNTDKLVTIWIFNGMFERLISFLDFEDAAVALIDEDQQDEVKALFQALTDFYKKLIDKFVQYYAIDAVFFHDDWGAQRSPFFSLATCREMLVPYLKQIVDHCHSHNLIFDFHCCGKNEPLVPAMIECDMDIWGGQPINDKKMLVDTYGDKILIGIHSPFNPAHPAPEDDEELYRQVEAFLAPYAEHLKEKPFFLMDIQPDLRVREAFYQITSKLLQD